MVWQSIQARVSIFVTFCIQWGRCSKKHRYPAIDPGGAIAPPELSPTPLLDFKAQSRYVPYIEDDESASLLVTAAVGRFVDNTAGFIR